MKNLAEKSTRKNDEENRENRGVLIGELVRPIKVAAALKEQTRALFKGLFRKEPIKGIWYPGRREFFFSLPPTPQLFCTLFAGNKKKSVRIFTCID